MKALINRTIMIAVIVLSYIGLDFLRGNMTLNLNDRGFNFVQDIMSYNSTVLYISAILLLTVVYFYRTIIFYTIRNIAK